MYCITCQGGLNVEFERLFGGDMQRYCAVPISKLAFRRREEGGGRREEGALARGINYPPKLNPGRDNIIFHISKFCVNNILSY